MNFGQAIEALKLGKKVCRAGWNGKGMWLMLVPTENWSCNGNAIFMDSIDDLTGCPWIGIRTAGKEFVPWLASQTDMLSEDWQIAE